MRPHTHVVGPGGATGLWHLDPDMVTIGKAVAGGLPMGAYGVTAELGEQLDTARNVATGGTLFGNPLSAAAAKAALTEVLLPGAYAQTAALGSELADGIADAIGAAGLPWTAIRLGPRSGQWYGPRPRTGAWPPLRAVVRAQAPHRGPGARAHRRPAHPSDPDLARQPGGMGSAARRRAHRPHPRQTRRRGPLPPGLPRPTRPAALTPPPLPAGASQPAPIYSSFTFGPQLGRVILNLVRAASMPSHLAQQQLYPLARHYPKAVVMAGSTALSELAKIRPGSPR
jgi:hypothetical protein